MRPWFRGASVLACAAVLVLVCGCSAQYYKRGADKEVYNIVRQKQQAVLGTASPFTIEPATGDPLEGKGRRVAADPDDAATPGPDTAKPTSAPAGKGRPQRILLSLREALEIAAENSREYQSRKESLYLEALSLTMDRFAWTPQLGWDLGGKWSSTASTPSDRTSGTSRSEKISASSDLSISQILSTGGKISARLSNDFLRYFTHGSDQSITSGLLFQVTQPLWRGAGARIARENITQAERDMVYAIRDFARYQKGFSVSIADHFYRILQQKDTVTNEGNTYRNLVQARERAEAMARAGRLAEFQVSENRRSELQAQDRWVRARETYRDRLDRFRISLGLPTDAPVEPDPRELDALRTQGLLEPEISQDDAVEIALERRMDFLTVQDELADATRKVEVALNSTRPDIELVASANYPTKGDTKPLKLRTDKGNYEVGLNVDVPLQQKSERNNYRRSLITLQRARRSVQASRDNIKLQVRGGWRRLQEAAESYRIQTMSVDLARRSVENTSMLLEAGRTTTRVYLDAQEDLVQAQNALVRALTDHAIARLEFYRDLELLQVDEKGMWKEQVNVNEANEPGA